MTDYDPDTEETGGGYFDDEEDDFSDREVALGCAIYLAIAIAVIVALWFVIDAIL